MSRKAKKKEGPSIPIPAFLRDAVGARLDDLFGKEKYPLLYEALAPKYEDGRPVTQPGKLSISVDGAHYRVRLDLPTYVLTSTIVCGSLATILDDVEAYLRGNPVFLPAYNRNKKRLPTLDDVIQ